MNENLLESKELITREWLEKMLKPGLTWVCAEAAGTPASATIETMETRPSAACRRRLRRDEVIRSPG